MTPEQTRLLQRTRRHFFSQCGVGIGQMALASLLNDGNLFAANAPSLDNPLAPRPPHFPREGQERHLSVHGRRAQPARNVRLQAEAAEVRRQEYAAVGAQRASASRSWIRSPRKRRSCSGRGANSSSTARPARWVSEVLPHIGVDRRRPDLHSHRQDRKLQPRPGEDLHEHRLDRVRPAQHGRLGHLRHRQRIGRPAGLRGAAVGPARAARRRAQLGRAASCRPPIRACRSARAATRSSTSRARTGFDHERQGQTLDAIRELNQHRLDDTGDPEISTRIAQYEMAYRMQTSGPELIDFSTEIEANARACTASKPGATSFANNCLLARRLIERGVRFVQLYHTDWDHHGGPSENLGSAFSNVCQRSRPALRGAGQGSQAARPARRHAGRLGRRIRPHADGRGARNASAATTTSTPTPCGSPAAA